MTQTAPLRIEVLVNGRSLGVAGVEQFGVVSAVLSWVRRAPSKITEEMRADAHFDEQWFLRERCTVELGGLDSITETHLTWAKEALLPGAEVTIRILGPGEVTPSREGVA